MRVQTLNGFSEIKRVLGYCEICQGLEAIDAGKEFDYEKDAVSYYVCQKKFLISSDGRHIHIIDDDAKLPFVRSYRRNVTKKQVQAIAEKLMAFLKVERTNGEIYNFLFRTQKYEFCN